VQDRHPNAGGDSAADANAAESPDPAQHVDRSHGADPPQEGDGLRPVAHSRGGDPPPASSGVREAGPTSIAGDSPEAAVRRLERMSHYLDTAFRVPGTEYRFGLDPLLGLVPVAGDTVGAVLEAYIVAEAAALGAPRETLLRMLFNVLVDTTLGSLPVVGDLFDATWKANARNVRLLEARTSDPSGATADRRFLVAAGTLLVAVTMAVSVATTALLWWLLGQVGLL
jgi:hypothetical protein